MFGESELKYYFNNYDFCDQMKEGDTTEAVWKGQSYFTSSDDRQGFFPSA